MKPMHIETLSIHADHEPDGATGALVPPIHLATTFLRDADGSYPGGYSYIRNSNPNRAGLERCMAALEGGVAAMAFSSGSAAIMGILQALTPGDHVIASQEI